MTGKVESHQEHPLDVGFSPHARLTSALHCRVMTPAREKKREGEKPCLPLDLPSRLASPTLPTMPGPALPDKIGSLLFCPSCGTLLDVPGDEDIIKCEPCGMTQDASSECAPDFLP